MNTSIPTDPAVVRVDHQSAVAEFVAAARAVRADQWEHARDATHWSPAQIAEHVRKTYEVVGAQFAGGPGLTVRSKWWIRPFLKWTFLGRILKTGVFPSNARAPREIRPGNGPFDRESLLAALQTAATEAEDRLIARWSDPACRMTHHVFGALEPSEGARLVTVHTLHHAKQLRTVAALRGSAH